MPVKKLKIFLDDNAIRYVSISHSSAYTAQEIAASAHIPGRELAKTVIVKLDGVMAMAVLPASYHVDLEVLKKTANAKTAELALEAELKDRFPDCDLGAMPPFGNLYGMPVYAAKRLSEDEFIAFNAGSHRELLKLAYQDFHDIIEPIDVPFSKPIPCQPKRYTD